MAKTQLSMELHNAIVWLERQPGVQSVVQGRYTRARHQHKPGFARIASVDPKSVHVRAYDKKGVKDLFVHAPMAPQRDAWVAQLAGIGAAASGNGSNGAAPHLKAETLQKAISGTAAAGAQPLPQFQGPQAGNIVHVTPEMAEKFLERNTRNRKLRQSVVNKYAADMRAGRWMVGPDAIAFDVNGAIINGQHRLWAVFESGMTVPMVVMTGLEPGVVAVLDDHLKRNMADVAGIRKPGTALSTVHTSVANLLLQTSILATAVDRRQALERITRQAQLEALDRHWDAIEFVHRDCFHSARMRGVTVAPVLTPMARAYYTQDRERLRRFGKTLLSGMAEDPKTDQPAIMLRNVLLRFATGGIRAASDVVYRKTERALAAFLEGERLATLYEASGELFPLPEDSRPARKK